MYSSTSRAVFSSWASKGPSTRMARRAKDHAVDEPNDTATGITDVAPPRNVSCAAHVVGSMRHKAAKHPSAAGQRSGHTRKPVYGNFQRYYHIRNPTSLSVSTGAPSSVHPALALDNRVAALVAYISCHAIPVTDVLDIGCNSGKLTLQLAQTLPRYAAPQDADGRQTNKRKPLHVLGVDIDPDLIHQAKEAAAVARSLQRPQGVPETLVRSSSSAESPGTVAAPHLPADASFFPSVFPVLFGSIPAFRNPERTGSAISVISDADTPERTEPVPSAVPDASTQLSPPYLDFIAAEWANLSPSSPTSPFDYSSRDLDRVRVRDSLGYDVVLALSLTKWVHIQQGDAGLGKLFSRIRSVLRPNGLLLLEPQEWRSYASTHGLEPRVRAKIKALQLRPLDFEWILEALGLHLVQTIAHGVGVGFSRPLQVFRKIEDGGGAEIMARHWLCAEPQSIPWVARA